MASSTRFRRSDSPAVCCATSSRRAEAARGSAPDVSGRHSLISPTSAVIRGFEAFRRSPATSERTAIRYISLSSETFFPALSSSSASSSVRFRDSAVPPEALNSSRSLRYQVKSPMICRVSRPLISRLSNVVRRPEQSNCSVWLSMTAYCVRGAVPRTSSTCS